MKKVIFISLFAVIVFFLLFGEDIYHNSTDNMYWKKLNSSISDDNIAEIILESKNEIRIIGDEKKGFIKDLNEAKFYRSNGSKIGPTGPVITLILKDGSKQYFEYWGEAIFETTYSNRQFLIKSNEIERVLKGYNITIN